MLRRAFFPTRVSFTLRWKAYAWNLISSTRRCISWRSFMNSVGYWVVSASTCTTQSRPQSLSQWSIWHAGSMSHFSVRQNGNPAFPSSLWYGQHREVEIDNTVLWFHHLLSTHETRVWLLWSSQERDVPKPWEFGSTFRRRRRPGTTFQCFPSLWNKSVQYCFRNFSIY